MKAASYIGRGKYIAPLGLSGGLSPRADSFQLVCGLLALSIQFVQIGGAQLGQLWAVTLIPLLLVKRSISVRAHEALAFSLFIGVALLLTEFSGYPRIKEIDQIIKFVVVYPVFYLLGRYFGRRYLSAELPFGYVSLFGFLLFQILLQQLDVPVLYQTVDFAQGALHGSFKERNWLAATFFFMSYMLFLQSERRVSDVAWFLGVGVAVALLSESKTVLIPCGIVLLTQIKGRNILKVLAISAGAILYYYRFSHELSGDLLRVRLEEERGLAFVTSIALVTKDWLGYGFGFVESYFATSPITVKGLGEGTNSVFCAPLDLMLIAGIPGVIAWLVFFCGLGHGWRTMLCLAPLAAWSVVNPMHQSEMAYLFAGYLVSWGRGMVVVDRLAGRSGKARWKARPPGSGQIYSEMR
ncbi:hypothetical protein AYM40_25205 [Paraburkholderia phytofirmans OLGA172]|uniref:Uncharacterized protein n=1 Tax=Paraburkholderia phytofirmans OLGA172 TaxID=1417228 RepID=A0A160FS22_9BURK|nr:hypothetical protein [Paraburkholderia phytofirmans]ANB75642.1 hypothetical protein AYM40_25205 [Paraburkholderia phytofirmans OLGA172]